MRVLTDVEVKITADRNLHAQEGENMKDQSDEMFAETEQWKEVVGNLQNYNITINKNIKILQSTMNRREIQLFEAQLLGEATDGDLSVA